MFRHPDDTNELAKPRGWELPSEFRGVPVEDGDEHDLTYLRGPVVVGLRAKGRAKRPSPFAVDVTTLEGAS